MRYIGVIIALIFFLSGEAMATAIPPDLKKVITFIFLQDGQGKPNSKPSGTGFFVATKNDEKTGEYGYLVTAKHVLRDEKNNYVPRIYLRVNKHNGSTDFAVIDLVYSGDKQNIFFHSDPTVDIAVIPGNPPSVVDFRVLPEDALSTKESFQEFRIEEGTDVFFTGLFLAHYGTNQNVPIIRFGKVAMITDEKVFWSDSPDKPAEPTDLYLLETQSYGGNSGSPVYFYLGMDRARDSIILGNPVIKLAGIMRGSYNNLDPIQFLPTTAKPTSIHNLGIAAVTPSYLLHEILFSDELKKWRLANPIKPSN
jgi:hypothetical protein